MRLTVGKGMDEYLKRLSNLEFTAPDMIGKAVYAGADIVADAIKSNIQNMRVDDTPHAERVTGIKSIQKEGLLRSFGVAKMQNDNGYYHVKVGFDGYNALKTKKYPSGQPNVMIARIFESGNSFTQKQPFVAPAVRATRQTAEAKMAMIVDSTIQNIMN